jgi:hypothetical protein
MLGCASGRTNVDRLRWRSWQLRGARGRGVLHVTDCTPNCAQGRERALGALVRLSRPVRCANRTVAFSWITIVTDRRISGRPRRTSGQITQPCGLGGAESPATPINVPAVALGESYASGEGLSPYLPGSDTPVDKCHRSQRAHSQRLLVPALVFQWSFFACSGATTEHVLSVTQNPGEGAPQLGRLTPEQWAQQGLIAISIGGDDVGFGPVLTECATRLDCHKRPQPRRRLAEAARLADKLVPVFVQLRQLAPQATIVATGYPYLFSERRVKRVCKEGGPKREGHRGRGPYEPAERAFINTGVEVVDGQIASAAARVGIWYVDPRRRFKYHGVCARDPWLFGLTPRGRGQHGDAGVASFHPNVTGQRQMADLIGELLIQPWDTTRWGLPVNPPPR